LYIDETETVEFGEVHVFAGPQFVITIRHGGAPDLAAIRRQMEGRPDLLRRGPVAILDSIINRVVDDYGPVVGGVENDIDENEDAKTLSGWAAILFAPTLVGTIYRMNFDHMPELHSRFAYLYALVLMVLVSLTLYLVFKRRKWI